MFERIVIIVDDNIRTEKIYIPMYCKTIEQLQAKSHKWKSYIFKMIYKQSMKDALKYLSETSNLVDVLVVDYDFNGEDSFSSGTEFVKYVRENINRHCQIVFYTMQGLNSIDKNELVDLINSDVFKIIDKSEEEDKLGEAIFDAATIRNPVVEALERFFVKYQTILSNYDFTLDGEKVSYESIINHIRMDDSKGRIFIEKLLQKALLLGIDIEV